MHCIGKPVTWWRDFNPFIAENGLLGFGKVCNNISVMILLRGCLQLKSTEESILHLHLKSKAAGNGTAADWSFGVV